MRVLLITGNHLHHRFIVSTICQSCEVVSWITEERCPMLLTPPTGIMAASQGGTEMRRF